MAILVTGGAGYVGSHIIAELQSHGEEVITVDNLSQGNRAALNGTTLYEIDITDYDSMIQIMKNHKIDSVVHCAASSLVEESVNNPLKYYYNNVFGTERLLSAMVECGIRDIVYSSSAAVYGEPEIVPITENASLCPTSPYGETKLVMERMLKIAESAHGIKSIGFRYFNAAGAHSELNIGESRDEETHLIPLLIKSAQGLKGKFNLFGNDYPTFDGSCIRDFIHVMDLANAHWLALKYLRTEGKSNIFNLGSEIGYSIKEIIQALEKISGKTIELYISERRSGDPAILIASSKKANEILGWEPQFSTLECILNTAWNWHSTNPYGYKTIMS
ncbi:UDP-glucose 4-epimerase GalE [Lysinibacillus sp. RSDA_15]|uniref:UDP-glucose 4-epimerase GalE n=1 Tax=Lysinibacillus TaxID=400634 RepID=UPI0018CDEC29|nr:UDP-glucose 4-epimerase GalE [Lysinibacillus sphaericus]MBG9754191.1 UDP-glucose 4-epimerase [Lysinibacillus sphaericus]QTB11596.1 UDP-glucose 4-epimerase GalE [Lysinibacillus sphaericus]